MHSRRRFLTGSSLLAATATLTGAPHIARSAESLQSAPGQKPKKIIHIVSDGMSMGTLTCANLLSRITRKKPLSWTQLWKNPAARVALMNTRSLNSMVTDSSAASSAWGSGSRVVNGAVNVLPDGALLTPLYKLFSEAGWKTGLVTTAEITHATPAGFAAAVKSRGDSDVIAVQYLERKIDVLLGGGRPFFSPNKRKDKRDLRGDFTKEGYTVVLDKAALEKAPLDTRLLGTFADGHLPYTIDHRNDAKLKAGVPTIAELTTAALARLERSERFILQVEGARIDHAAHNSDAAAALNEQIALDEAIDVCLEFQKKHPDTLIVITTDHANSNLGLNGMGGGYRTSSQQFASLANAKMSFPEILKLLEKAGEKVKVPPYPSDPEDKVDVPDPMAKIDPPKPKAPEDKTKFTAAVQADTHRVDPAKVVAVIAEATGYKMSLRRAELFSKVLAGTSPQLYDQMNPVVTQLGQVMGNRYGIGWTGNTHTADYVQLTALGPGSELFTGFVENTDVFAHYTTLAGIDFKNPSAPLIAHTGPEAHAAERPSRYSAWV
ncbi:MAG TPA: alkaline phosphatase [Verrucomicrobiales bacterium]|nr:alkaline phosphatase [Verrucomicrobiales bacterium]